MQVESDSLASGLIAYRFFDVPSFRVWGCHEGNTSIQNVNSLPINQTVKESLYPPPACQTGAGWRWSGAAPGHDQLGRRRLGEGFRGTQVMGFRGRISRDTGHGFRGTQVIVAGGVLSPWDFEGHRLL